MCIRDSDCVPGVVYTNPEVAGVGKTEEELIKSGLSYRVSKLPMAYSGRFVAENEQGNGLCKLIQDEEGKIIGCHILVNPASELIAVSYTHLEWSGLSYQEKQAGGQTGMVMALVFLFVFLFLAAQYESWTVPIAVLLSLPVAALGAYLGVWVCGLENDVYFQIGLVMLVGLAAKNAILIVEFAKVQVDKGEDLVQSAIYAAKLRFRPILMTSRCV